MLEVLGRAAVELQGSDAGTESDAQGSLLFRGGTDGVVPHGSTGAAGLGPEPGRRNGEGFILRGHKTIQGYSHR